MNADAFRHLYEYHFSENRKLWDRYVRLLSPAQFTHPVGYSYGSVRDQIVHIINADSVWFSELLGEEFAGDLDAEDFNDRDALREQWDMVEQKMRRYLAGLRDDMLLEHPIREPEEDRVLSAWQVLLHVVNHGTDHRAQVLRFLHDMGVETEYQDYIFYVYRHPLP